MLHSIKVIQRTSSVQRGGSAAEGRARGQRERTHRNGVLGQFPDKELDSSQAPEEGEAAGGEIILTGGNWRGGNLWGESHL